MRACCIDVDAGRARGRAQVPSDHPVLLDHFPGAPLLPGSLGIELAAQLAGPLAEEAAAAGSDARWALLAMVRDAKLLRPVPLPASLDIEAELTRLDTSSAGVRAVVSCAGHASIRAELVMALVAVDERHDEAVEARRARLRAWKDAWTER